MRPELNPFTPGSGLTPPELVGRDDEIAAFDLTVARSRGRRHSRGMVLHGLRGVGKTVLLNHFRDHAIKHGWLALELEGRPGEPEEEALRLGRALVRAAFQPLRLSHASERYRSALGTVKSFANSLDIASPNGIDPTPGRADSGRIEVDLEEVVEDLALALRESSGAMGLFIDEAQDISKNILPALLSVQHRAGQNEWPFYIIAAGLPGVPATFAAARSYAERLFDYRQIGPLSPSAAREALVAPVQRYGALFEPNALDKLLEASGGYPYFLQTYGQAAWNIAGSTERTITEDDADLAIREGNRELDMGFFLSRWERVPPVQRQYLHAMARIGGESVSTAEVAAELGKPLSKLSVVRQALITKTLIFAPERGRIAFSVPGMPEYVKRQFDE